MVDEELSGGRVVCGVVNEELVGGIVVCRSGEPEDSGPSIPRSELQQFERSSKRTVALCSISVPNVTELQKKVR